MYFVLTESWVLTHKIYSQIDANYTQKFANMRKFYLQGFATARYFFYTEVPPVDPLIFSRHRYWMRDHSDTSALNWIWQVFIQLWLKSYQSHCAHEMHTWILVKLPNHDTVAWACIARLCPSLDVFLVTQLFRNHAKSDFAYWSRNLRNLRTEKWSCTKKVS